MNTVKVTSKNNKIVFASTNPGKEEFGYMRVESKNTSFEKGWLKNEVRSALIRGKVKDLEALGMKEGSTITGKIYVRESLTPFSPTQDPKKNPESGAIITHGGQPVYRDSIFTADMSKADELLESDKVEIAVEATANLASQLA